MYSVKSTKWSTCSSFLPTLRCVEKAERIHLACIVDKSMSVTLSPLHPPPYAEECSAFISLICWTDCRRESCNQWFVIYLLFSLALMQSNTRSRLFEVLALGVVSWKWSLFCVNMFAGASMQIVAASSYKIKSVNLMIWKSRLCNICKQNGAANAICSSCTWKWKLVLMSLKWKALH